jgi:hypothetical protein
VIDLARAKQSMSNCHAIMAVAWREQAITLNARENRTEEIFPK